ncbi:MAG TPA: hypothetical protein VFE33_03935 [Thermoanaerobaculia bacterium]|nr:hypothetical protein [Thermoanaerobaculia bacterium]
MAAPSRQVPLAVRILVTVLLVALYALGGQVPLPFVAVPAGTEIPRWASVASLGIEPLVLGFGFVGVFGLLLPAVPTLLTLRRGIARLALPASLVCAVIQAVNLVVRLEGESAIDRQPHLLAPGGAPWLAIVGTLAAATAAIYLLGNALTAWGLGNGFCLFFLVSMANRLSAYLDHPPARSSGGWTFVFFVLAAILTGLYLRQERRVEVAVAGTEAIPPVPVALPAFPQTILPLLATYWLFQTLFRTGRLPRILTATLSAQVVVLALLVATLGLLTYARVGRPQRFLADLPGAGPAEPGPFTLQFLLGTAFLCGGIAVYAIAGRYAVAQVALFPFPLLLPLVALGLDLAEALRFFRRHRGATLATFDDLALASYWQSRLDAHGIPALLTASSFRGLYSRFLPLVTIDLRVPVERLDEARALQLIVHPIAEPVLGLVPEAAGVPGLEPDQD